MQNYLSLLMRLIDSARDYYAIGVVANCWRTFRKVCSSESKNSAVFVYLGR